MTEQGELNTQSEYEINLAELDPSLSNPLETLLLEKFNNDEIEVQKALDFHIQKHMDNKEEESGEKIDYYEILTTTKEQFKKMGSEQEKAYVKEVERRELALKTSLTIGNREVLTAIRRNGGIKEGQILEINPEITKYAFAAKIDLKNVRERLEGNKGDAYKSRLDKEFHISEKLKNNLIDIDNEKFATALTAEILKEIHKEVAKLDGFARANADNYITGILAKNPKEITENLTSYLEDLANVLDEPNTRKDVIFAIAPHEEDKQSVSAVALHECPNGTIIIETDFSKQTINYVNNAISSISLDELDKTANKDASLLFIKPSTEIPIEEYDKVYNPKKKYRIFSKSSKNYRGYGENCTQHL